MPVFPHWLPPPLRRCDRQVHDEYLTIERDARSELKVEGSRFIATARRIAAEKDARQILDSVRKEFFDATHHCYAYRIGSDGTQFRYNDDGEPAGSGGKPILGAIDRASLTGLVVVVSRYFGGTKLGIGGLSRAYGSAAEASLKAAGRVTRYVTETIKAAFPHACVGGVMSVVSRTGAKITDTTYDEEVHLTLEIRKSRAAELRSGLVDQTSGNIRIHTPDRKA